MPRWTANKQVNNVEVEHKLNGENNSTREARLSGPLRQFFSFVSIHTPCRHAHISLYYSLVMCFLFILFSLFPLVWCACHVSVAWKRGARSSYCSISLFAMSEEKQKQKTQFQARAKDAFTKLLMPIMWGEQASLRCTERVNKLSAEKWKSAYNRTKVIRCVVCMLSVNCWRCLVRSVSQSCQHTFAWHELDVHRALRTDAEHKHSRLINCLLNGFE